MQDSRNTGTLPALGPIMAVVFIGYLIIGIPLPVLPLYVHHDLGLSTVMVGLVAGSQFAAAVLSRMWAGHLSDSRGAKTAVITGALSWGMLLAGPQRTGKVIAWIGTALFAALAGGAPVGTLLYTHYGFWLVGVATTLLPLAALAVVLPMPSPPIHASSSRPSFRSVLKAVWLPGVGIAISGTAFGAVTTFSSLLFAERGWQPIWLAVTAFSVALIAGRAVLGHLPDRLGGAKVALVSMLVQAVGLAAVGFAAGSRTALAGVTLTGLGYALVYPGLGVEAMRHASRENRGVVMGAYTAFLDVSLGLGNPLLGVIAGAWGLGAVFYAGAIAAVAASITAAMLIAERSRTMRG